MTKRDLTPQEAVREARKLDLYCWWRAIYGENGEKHRGSKIKSGGYISDRHCIEGGHDQCAVGTSFRSCLAKLKKEVGK